MTQAEIDIEVPEALKDKKKIAFEIDLPYGSRPRAITAGDNEIHVWYTFEPAAVGVKKYSILIAKKDVVIPSDHKFLNQFWIYKKYWLGWWKEILTA